MTQVAMTTCQKNQSRGMYIFRRCMLNPWQVFGIGNLVADMIT